MAWIEKSGKKTWRVRYFRDDNTIASIPGFTSDKAAENKATAIESEQSEGRFTDPTTAKTKLAAFVENDWLDALDVGERTEENYLSQLRIYILPRWADTALDEITSVKIKAWRKDLSRTGLADVTVDGIVKLLGLILADAADARIIPAAPNLKRRRGRRRRAATREKVWATPAQVLQICDQAFLYYGWGAAILILVAAFTGARWGELVGLRRRNLHLTRHDDDTYSGYFDIDPDTGTLHESSAGRLWLDEPKTPESARKVTLPPFLVPLLLAYLATHSHTHVFVTTDGQQHRRSNFTRRAMRPAADGNTTMARPRIRLVAICVGLTFHGLRHGHKTWMIADGVPEVGQSRRLGHKLPDKVQEVYSHVADEVETRLLAALEQRWTDALNDPRTTTDITTIAWRTQRGAALAA
jgi:integrase